MRLSGYKKDLTLNNRVHLCKKTISAVLSDISTWWWQLQVILVDMTLMVKGLHGNHCNRFVAEASPQCLVSMNHLDTKICKYSAQV